MKASVCMATFDRDPEVLDSVLRSIAYQSPPFELEVIVVDDGSSGHGTRVVCEGHPVVYLRIDRPPDRRNPCVARNVACRAARGDYLILQSDDVDHITQNSIATLVDETERHPDSFVIANVLGCGPDGVPWSEYTGPKRLKPLFFLGAVRRADVFAIGGNDEDFADTPGYEDQWFADCLRHGRKLVPRFITSVVGHHLYHPRSDTDDDARAAKAIYESKRLAAEASGEWIAAGGEWRYE